MMTRTGSQPGNTLSPHDILRHNVLKHARAAYRDTMARVPSGEAQGNLKLAAASTPEAQEDDDQDKAAFWLPSGADAATTADGAAQAAGAASSATHGAAASVGASAEASAAGGTASTAAGTASTAGGTASATAGTAGVAAGTAGAVGMTAAAGSTLLGPGILGAFALAAGANLNDGDRMYNLSARNRLSTGRDDGSREDGNKDSNTAGTDAPQLGTTTTPSANAALLATGITPAAPSQPTNDGTAGTSAAPAAPTEPAKPVTSGTDTPRPTEGGHDDTPPQAKPLPTYAGNTSVSYAHSESKVLGAAIFSGSNEETAPAFVRLTSIQGKEGDATAGTMSLQGGNAIVPHQIISRADFDKVVWDASKNEGGSFKFIPVQDAQGTALPGAVEQTVTIHEAPALPTYEADVSVAYTYNQSKAVGADIFNGTDSATAPSFVRITAIQGKDGEAAANTMSLQDGDALTTGSVVSRADFDKVVWDASKNEGGSFKFIPVQDAQGTALPGAVEQTVSINEAKPLFHIAAGYFDPVEEHPAYVKVTNITESNDTNGILDALVLGEDGSTQLKVGDIIRAEDFDKVYWNHASNEGGEIFLTPYNANDRMVDPGPYSMELEPSWKTPDKKSLPLPHHERETTDASPELVGVAHPATDGVTLPGAQAQPPGMMPLSTNSTTLLDSLLEQHPSTVSLL